MWFQKLQILYQVKISNYSFIIFENFNFNFNIFSIYILVSVISTKKNFK